MVVRRTQQARREETQQQVLQAAVSCFGEKGYAACSLDDIAQACHLTIRPIYHYFGNKKNLFLAVTEYLEQQLAEGLAESLQLPLHSQQQGWRVFLQWSRDKAFRQVVLIDAPQILGRERWIQSAVIQQVRELLQQLRPDIDEHKRELLLRVLMASLAEVALTSATLQPEDPLMPELEKIVDSLFRSLLST